MDSSHNQPIRSGPSPLDLAKLRLTIPVAWHQLNLPGTPKKLCRSPVREDKNASFSISPDGRLFHDFATKEAGDIVAFVALVKRCTLSDAACEVIRLAAIAPAASPPQPRVITPKKCLRVPNLTKPKIGDLEVIQRVRGWPFFAGLEIAAERGLLYICTMADDGVPRRAWAITDSARRSIQVRRLDGQPWAWNDAKAWTLGGSVAGWPIGTTEIADYPMVHLCEGGPDFLADHGLAWLAGVHRETAAVCVPGASAKICSEALPYFAGKRVRIFEHADQVGKNAGLGWAAQLMQAGAIVDGFTFDPPHKDLADVFAATDAETLIQPTNIFDGNQTQGTQCP